jgi:hypothetical protein
MTAIRPFAALLGFLFVAAWINFNFGYAVLCLIGAALFWLIAALIEGSVDLGELQERFGPRRDGGRPATTPPRARVQ